MEFQNDRSGHRVSEPSSRSFAREIFRGSEDAESKATSLKEAHEQPAGARSFEGAIDYALSELPRNEAAAPGVSALRVLQGAGGCRYVSVRFRVLEELWNDATRVKTPEGSAKFEKRSSKTDGENIAHNACANRKEYERASLCRS